MDYGLEAIESSPHRPPATPLVLLSQARLAARRGISLDTMLRRYVAGYAALGECLIEEADRMGLDGGEAVKVTNACARQFDHLLAAVGEEHSREAVSRAETPHERRAQLVSRLLLGESFDAPELAYDLNLHHLGAVTTGTGALAALREMARALDYRLLVIPREATTWAWLGGRRPVDPEVVQLRIASGWPPQARLAIGEPGEGIHGWRLTHRQARAAMGIARRGSLPFIRYTDVALLASVLQDDLLATSLRELYLSPLERERDGGQTFRETLRAYFAASRNVSSAAAALGVNRNTVASRLRTVEERIGRSLDAAGSEIEAALRLQEIEPSAE
jgi:DNA-binding PucR family transcriptional regulator